MDAKHISGAVAATALAAYWITHWRRNVVQRQQRFEEKCLREAVETFEGEGGLVPA
jgi:hypothetical protein